MRLGSSWAGKASTGGLIVGFPDGTARSGCEEANDRRMRG